MIQSRVQVTVRYAETDMMGVVYHANYLPWFEVGRTTLLKEIGVPYRKLEEEGFSDFHFAAEKGNQIEAGGLDVGPDSSGDDFRQTERSGVVGDFLPCDQGDLAAAGFARPAQPWPAPRRRRRGRRRVLPAPPGSG